MVNGAVENYSIAIVDNYREQQAAHENTRYAKFHVPNLSIGSVLPIGEFIQYDDGSNYAGRIELDSNLFSVTIDLTRNAKERFSELKDRGGYLFTHIGKIEWKNGRPENVKNDLDIVAFYLWFVTGRETGPCLTATFDENANQLDQAWDLRAIEMYMANSSWALAHRKECITSAFPEFASLCSDPESRGVIFDVIHWYVESQTGNITMNSSIVLLQTALEKIATLFLTEDVFNGSAAPRKIELLLQACDMPNEVPEGTQIRDQTALPGINTISSAVTRIRNNTVHPTRTNREALSRFELQASMGIEETYLIGTWALQLVLLKLFKFSGCYRNVVTGEIESVPWCNEAP
jgi:hypothetical protein